jgi:hypothetical protein
MRGTENVPSIFLFLGITMQERHYQAFLIRRLKDLFPGCVVIKNDSGYRQGIPDLTIFYFDRWAALEVKASESAPEQPNQRFYVDSLNEMSFAAFIYPENEGEVLRELQLAFNHQR